jgi:hypothetical protein
MDPETTISPKTKAAAAAAAVVVAVRLLSDALGTKGVALDEYSIEVLVGLAAVGAAWWKRDPLRRRPPIAPPQ